MRVGAACNFPTEFDRECSPSYNRSSLPESGDSRDVTRGHSSGRYERSWIAVASALILVLVLPHKIAQAPCASIGCWCRYHLVPVLAPSHSVAGLGCSCKTQSRSDALMIAYVLWC